MTLSDEPVPGKDQKVYSDCQMSAIVAGVDEFTASHDNPEAGSVTDLAALLVAVATKDRQAFETLYDATVPRIFSLAMRITRQQPLAEEVVSDVYLQVWQQAHAYSPTRGSVIAWLCVLCRSRALDALRRDNTALRQAETALDAAPEPEELHQPPDLLQSVEQGSAIQVALGELTEQQRQLVALAYFRGYTHSELAAITGLPVGTVKTHLHRTMIRLRELMSDATSIIGGSDG